MKTLKQLGICAAPWSIVDFCASHYGVASSSGYRTSDTRRLEDARLIAAAPEMYEVLCEFVESVQVPCDKDCEQCRLPNCTVFKAKTVLKKAAGEEAGK